MSEKLILEDIQRQNIYLPNGKAGFLYNQQFSLDKLALNCISDHYFEFPEDLPFSYDKELHLITGAPETAKEYELRLFFKLENQENPEVFHEKIVKLIINPDPKSLWKNLESDASDPYWRKDNDSQHYVHNSFHVIAGSKRGRSHAHEGKFRDDDFVIAPVADTGWLLLGVADGAGSAKYSRRGSEIACKSLSDFFNLSDSVLKLKLLDEQLLILEKEKTEEQQKSFSKFLLEFIGTAAYQAQKDIQAEATLKEATIKDFATTLLFLIVKKFDFGTITASFWIGDGGMGIYDREKPEVTMLGIPDSGEFAGQTRFLTMPDTFANGNHYARIKLKKTTSFTSIVLMTDGITDPKFKTDANLSNVEAWNSFWQDLNGKNEDHVSLLLEEHVPEKSTRQLMEWMDFWEPGNHDDRTMIILYEVL